jgi:hypothetical protein
LHTLTAPRFISRKVKAIPTYAAMKDALHGGDLIFEIKDGVDTFCRGLI